MSAPVERDFDYAEAARLLRVSEDWLRHETPRRPLPHFKLAGKVRFLASDIDAIRAMGRPESRPVPAMPVPARRRSSRRSA